MLRFIITIIFTILFFILSIPLYLFELILGLFSPNAKETSSRAIVRFGFNIVKLLSGTKVEYKGIDNLPKDEPCLYIANHSSFFDVILTFPVLPGRVGFVSKKEFFKIYPLSIWMLFIKCLFLDRNDIKQGLKTILTAIEYVKSGISIFIFPEGTRSKNGKMLPFKEGSFKIATKSGCPIVPIAITNTANIFENHFPKISAEKVIIEFGAPIYPKELSKEELKFIGEHTQGIIQNMLDSHSLTE